MPACRQFFNRNDSEMEGFDMRRSTSQLKQLARECLAHRYRLPVLAFVTTLIIVLIVDALLDALFPVKQSLIVDFSYIAASFITSLLFSILSVGPITILLDMSRGGQGRFSDLFYAFRHQPDRIILSQLLISLLSSLCFLPGTILLVISTVALAVAGDDILWAAITAVASVIPMIIGAVFAVYLRLCYALVIPLYIDCPQTGVMDLLRESRMLMKGNIGRCLWLMVSFIPLLLISVIALFIPVFWSYAYAQMAFLQLYRELVGEI